MDVKDIREATLRSLNDAVETHNYLLRKHIDRDEVGVNTFGDTVMKIDYECKEAVFDAFRTIATQFHTGFRWYQKSMDPLSSVIAQPTRSLSTALTALQDTSKQAGNRAVAP